MTSPQHLARPTSILFVLMLCVVLSACEHCRIIGVARPTATACNGVTRPNLASGAICPWVSTQNAGAPGSGTLSGDRDFNGAATVTITVTPQVFGRGKTLVATIHVEVEQRSDGPGKTKVLFDAAPITLFTLPPESPMRIGDVSHLRTVVTNPSGASIAGPATTPCRDGRVIGPSFFEIDGPLVSSVRVIADTPGADVSEFNDGCACDMRIDDIVFHQVQVPLVREIDGECYETVSSSSASGGIVITPTSSGSSSSSGSGGSGAGGSGAGGSGAGGSGVGGVGGVACPPPGCNVPGESCEPAKPPSDTIDATCGESNNIDIGVWIHEADGDCIWIPAVCSGVSVTTPRCIDTCPSGLCGVDTRNETTCSFACKPLTPVVPSTCRNSDDLDVQGFRCCSVR